MRPSTKALPSWGENREQGRRTERERAQREKNREREQREKNREREQRERTEREEHRERTERDIVRVEIRVLDEVQYLYKRRVSYLVNSAARLAHKRVALLQPTDGGVDLERKREQTERHQKDTETQRDTERTSREHRENIERTKSHKEIGVD